MENVTQYFYSKQPDELDANEREYDVIERNSTGYTIEELKEKINNLKKIHDKTKEELQNRKIFCQNESAISDVFININTKYKKIQRDMKTSFNNQSNQTSLFLLAMLPIKVLLGVELPVLMMELSILYFILLDLKFYDRYNNNQLFCEIEKHEMEYLNLLEKQDILSRKILHI